jgi:hypothetical protein
MLAVADFNGDGIADLATANSGSATVSVMLGKGDWSFTIASNVAVGNFPVSLAVGDFNGNVMFETVR